MRARGYTLIEILVVVAIMAIVAGAAMLALGAAGNARQVERESQRLAELARAVCERALATGHDYGIHLGRGGYAFSRGGYRRWEIESAGDLRPRVLPDGFDLSASREGKPLELTHDTPLEPQLVCYASGELTPFVARIEIDPQSVMEVVGEIDATLTTRQAPLPR
jgi:general secretion pathway protein H